jgi:hypothetical protein
VPIHPVSVLFVVTQIADRLKKMAGEHPIEQLQPVSFETSWPRHERGPVKLETTKATQSATKHLIEKMQNTQNPKLAL